MHFLGFGAGAACVSVPEQTGEKKEIIVINQLCIVGFVGKNAETKHLANGTAVVKFSVATKKSWKDDQGEWKERT